MRHALLLGCLLAALLSLVPAAVASPTLTVKQAKTETRKAAISQAKSFAGYPDRVSYKVGGCTRRWQRRVICNFTVTKRLDDGSALLCPSTADVRVQAGKPKVYAVVNLECKKG